VKPEEIVETLKNQLTEWFNLGLKNIKSRPTKKACRKLISLYVGVIDDDLGGFSNLLKTFDLEFVRTPEQIFFVLQSLIFPIASMVPTKILQYKKEIKRVDKYWAKHRRWVYSKMGNVSKT
jgi:hypothetical protein